MLVQAHQEGSTRQPQHLTTETQMALPVTRAAFFSMPCLHRHRLMLRTSPSAVGYVSPPPAPSGRLSGSAVLASFLPLRCLWWPSPRARGIPSHAPSAGAVWMPPPWGYQVRAGGRGAEPAPGEGAPRWERLITVDAAARGASH
jgi:hypothetical protein